VIQQDPDRARGPVTILWNPAAGAARPDAAATAAKRFEAAGLRAHIVGIRPGEEPSAAARAASVHSPIVVAAGGDGTVSAVAAGLAGTATVLGVLPLGTLNHFAKDLRIPVDLDEAVATIVAGRVQAVDVVQVNDRLFINNSSIGLYPSIVDARDELRRRGMRKWPAMAMATFRMLRRYRGVLVRVEADGTALLWRTPFVFIGNNEYAVDGISMGGRARLDGGRLFVYRAQRIRTRHLPALLLMALLGRARRSGAFDILATTEVKIDTPHRRTVRLALDGEVMRMTMPLRYRVIPGALKVLVPAA
jgi:diacylglycerol kinase family enzyme